MKYMPGDIFLIDSNRTPAKIVKFLMTAPTIWQHIWRGIRGKNDKVDFYHAGMIMSNNMVIEQQDKVEFENVYDAFQKKDRYVVWRKKDLSPKQRIRLIEIAQMDLGEGYDIPLIFGKTLSWLTGIKQFTRFVEAKEKDICVTRVGYWYHRALGYTFGVRTWHEITTKLMNQYCLTHSEEWEIVDFKGVK